MGVQSPQSAQVGISALMADPAPAEDAVASEEAIDDVPPPDDGSTYGGDVAANEIFIQTAGLEAKTEEMQLMLDSNPEIQVDFENQDGWTALCWASGLNNVTSIRFLDEAGAKIDRQNKFGNTALRYAAANAKLEAVECLLELGSDCNMIQQDTFTPFIAACAKDRCIECVRAMMQFNGPQGCAKLQLETPAGKTALHEASGCG